MITIGDFKELVDMIPESENSKPLSFDFKHKREYVDTTENDYVTIQTSTIGGVEIYNGRVLA